MTSGPIVDNKYSGLLNKYRGGRYLGSGDRVAQENGNDGVVTMRFESGTKGYIKFANEEEKEISRFNFAYSDNAQSLKGIWLLTPLNSLTPTSDVVLLEKLLDATDYGTGMLATSDYKFACENLVRGPNAGLTMCVKVNASGALLRAYFFKNSVNDGEGVTGITATSIDDPLIVRRLTTSNEDGTGIFLKNSGAEKTIDPAILRNAFEKVAGTQR